MTLSLKPFDRGKARTPEQAMMDIARYNPNIVDSLEKPEQTQGIFRIEDLDNSYRLCDVYYGGRMWAFDWYKQLLLEGKNQHQDKWIERTQDNRIKLPNSQMVYACVHALYANKDNPTQKTLVDKVVEEIFKPDITTNFPHNSTRVAYQPQGNDRVIHNLGCADQFNIYANITGPNNLITPNNWIIENSNLVFSMNALLGTLDPAQVEQACEWLSGQKPHLYVLNQKPKKETKRTVMLGISDIGSRFLIDAYYNIDEDRPARGVVARRMEELQK